MPTQAAPQKPGAAVAKWEPPQTLSNLAKRLQYDPAKLYHTLKNIIFSQGENAAPVTDEQLYIAVALANTYRLNPLTKEIYLIRGERGVQACVGVDGWIKVVNDQERYDGSDTVANYDNEGKLVSVTCTMWVKNRNHPTVVTEFYDECVRFTRDGVTPTKPWKMMPHRMLRHKAFMQAARYAFGISGIPDEEEARDIVGDSPSVTVHTSPAPSFQTPDDDDIPMDATVVPPSAPPQTDAPYMTKEEVEQEHVKGPGPEYRPSKGTPAPSTPTQEPANGKASTLLSIRTNLEEVDASEGQLMAYMKAKHLCEPTDAKLDDVKHSGLLKIVARWNQIKNDVAATEA